jgi:predicted membrane-bound dolichyl-phosphate-mannose-protein mannosyltransferase
MTRGPVGRRGASIPDLSRLDAGTLLGVILIGGFVLRLFIAGVLLPLSGFAIDIGDFTAWGQRMASVGPGGFYQAGYFSDYPPGYLYVLWLLGEIGSLLAPLVGQNATAGLVKVPGILADVAVAYLLFVICRRWAGDLLAGAGGFAARIRPETLGLIAASVYLLNPGTIFNASVWGQIDSVGALILLGTVYLLARGWTEAAAVTATLAMLVKFQFAFIIPIVAVVGIKRHLLGRSSDPLHAARRDAPRILYSLAAALATLLVVTFPFGVTLYTPLAGGDPNGLLGFLPEADPVRSLVGKFVEAAGTYTGLSINAFNMWRNPWSGLGDTLTWGDDTTLAVAGLTWQQVGVLLFAAVALVALWQVARRDDLRGVLVAALLLAIAFFVLPTRVHERYLFPALALAAPLVVRGWSWTALYAALSASFLANIYWVYTEDWSFAGERIMNPGFDGLPMPQLPALSATLFTDPGIYLFGVLSLAILGAALWASVRLGLRPRVAEGPMLVAVEESAAAPPPPTWADAPLPVTEPADAPATRGLLGWLRPDPTDPYLRERPRRLDRRDAAILLGLVLFAFVFRLWRLDLPRSMHFDEVYHARSAAEWMADWEHGWNRDVYEWTHPMLAKYLIAAGIVAVDPNKVTGESELDAPALVVTVAPARASEARDASVLFGAEAAGEITARDAESGDELASWSGGGPVAALAYDEDGDRLLVGRADSGALETYALAAFLAADGARAPPPLAAPIETGLDAVLQIVLSDASDRILFRSTRAIAALDTISGELVTADVAAAWIGRLPRAGDEGPERLVATLSDRNVVAFYDATTLEPITNGDGAVEIVVEAPLIGPFVARGSDDDQQVLALTGPLPATDEHPATDGGIAGIDADEIRLIDTVPLPGRGTIIGLHSVVNLLYVAGTSGDDTPVVWTITTQLDNRDDTGAGLAAYDETALPAPAIAMAFDVATTSPSDDQERLLVATTSGTRGGLVTIDVGSNAFAWRIAGIVFGAILVGLVYLLAATMFARRRIAVLAAVFVAIDGMSFVMSRISMNDVFVVTFIVAAYALFWQVWSGRWRRSAWWAMPLVGVLIGLAAGTKWVGFYALAGLLVLVLARSPLGRLFLVAGVAFLFVAGGIGAPWPFALFVAVASAVALAVAYAKPIRIDSTEALLALSATLAVLAGVGLAFVVGHDQVPGRDPGSSVEGIFSYLARGTQAAWPALLMVGLAAALVVVRAVASLRDPDSDARWYRPGELGGFAWSWVGACLVVIPLAVYFLTYVPYLELGHAVAGLGDSGPGYGWSLDELHAQMFGYHFNLTASHPSSSPWWSWPLDLKPTWFYGGSFDGDQIAAIYNGGNPILFWAGVPALIVCAALAWKRRSPALVLLVIAFGFQFVPWARIERATFAYHYLTALIFAMIAVAYLVDEAMRRPDWREVAIGYLALAAFAGLLIFPLSSALPMPDWYINAARALPPWNYGFQFPDPPAGDRGDLLGTSAVQVIAGAVVAVAAGAFAIWGRSLVHRFTADPPVASGQGEIGLPPARLSADDRAADPEA